jgi:molybdopterin/thiamine biosynthesis adenylyltransferase
MKVITIVGVGALGSHLVTLLRNEGVDLRVIDFDRVEQKNTASQFHGKPHVGKTKVESLRQTMKLLWGSNLTGFPIKLTKDNVHELLRRSDLVIDCVDNGETRHLIQGYVRAEGIPCLHGALDATGSFGRVVWDSSFAIDDEPSGGQATCENGDFLPFIAITAAYLARSAQVYLRDGKKVGFSITPIGTIST